MVLLTIKTALRVCEERYCNPPEESPSEGELRLEDNMAQKAQNARRLLWTCMRQAKLHFILFTYVVQILQDTVGLLDEVFAVCVDAMSWFSDVFPPAAETLAPACACPTSPFLEEGGGGEFSSSARSVTDALYILQRWICEDAHVCWEIKTLLETFSNRSDGYGFVSMSVRSDTGSTISVVDLLRTVKSLPLPSSPIAAVEDNRRINQLLSALKQSYPVNELKSIVRDHAMQSMFLDSSTLAPINSVTPDSSAMSPSPAVAGKSSLFSKTSFTSDQSVPSCAPFFPPLVPPPGGDTADTFDATPSHSCGADETELPTCIGDTTPTDCKNIVPADDDALLFSSAETALGELGSPKMPLHSRSSSKESRSARATRDDVPRSPSPSAAAAIDSLQSSKKLVVSPGMPGRLPPPTPPPLSSKPWCRGRRHVVSAEGRVSYEGPATPTSPESANTTADSASCSSTGCTNVTVKTPTGESPIRNIPVLHLTPSPPKSPKKTTSTEQSWRPESNQCEGHQQRFVRKRHVA